MTVLPQNTAATQYFVFFLKTTSNQLAKTVGFVSRSISLLAMEFFENRYKSDTRFVMMTK